MADEDSPWYVQLLTSIGLLVGVAALLCVLLAVFGIGAAFIFGFRTGSSGSSAVTIPAVTHSPQSGAHSPAAGGSSPTPPSPSRAAQGITLTASPNQVPVYGRIDLRGRYAAPDGTSLQVQRSQPGTPWQDFPTQASVNGGSFSTYIKTGHTGLNRLRVIDVQRHVVSNVVTVRVG